MATYRWELRPYFGEYIEIKAFVTSRADGGQYGFLLEDIDLPGGRTLDHVWLRTYDLDLAEASGTLIVCDALVDHYWSEGAERHGRDGSGIGFADVKNVRVLDGGEVPLAEWATRHRKKRRADIKASKREGTYVWPGTWTYSTGRLRVKAAASAAPGAKCRVLSKTGFNDTTVFLLDFDKASKTWSWEDTEWCGECGDHQRVSNPCAHQQRKKLIEMKNAEEAEALAVKKAAEAFRAAPQRSFPLALPPVSEASRRRLRRCEKEWESIEARVRARRKTEREEEERFRENLLQHIWKGMGIAVEQATSHGRSVYRPLNPDREGKAFRSMWQVRQAIDREFGWSGFVTE